MWFGKSASGALFSHFSKSKHSLFYVWIHWKSSLHREVSIRIEFDVVWEENVAFWLGLAPCQRPVLYVISLSDKLWIKFEMVCVFSPGRTRRCIWRQSTTPRNVWNFFWIKRPNWFVTRTALRPWTWPSPIEPATRLWPWWSMSVGKRFSANRPASMAGSPMDSSRNFLPSWK